MEPLLTRSMARLACDYLKLADGVEVRDGVLYYDDEPMHDALAQKIIQDAQGNEEPTALVNFLIWLKTESSRNSRDQLFGWLEKSGFELTGHWTYHWI